MFLENAVAGPSKNTAAWLMLGLVVTAIALPGLCALAMPACPANTASCQSACAISGGTSATAIFTFYLIFVLPATTGVAPLFADRIIVHPNVSDAWRPLKRLFRPPR